MLPLRAVAVTTGTVAAPVRGEALLSGLRNYRPQQTADDEQYQHGKCRREANANGGAPAQVPCL